MFGLRSICLYHPADHIMNKENNMTREEALRELARNMNWSAAEADYFWEGGGHNPEMDTRLHQDMVSKGYLGDSDDVPSFAQFMYDEFILSPAALEELELDDAYIQWAYICVWGDGYMGSDTNGALVEKHMREWFTPDLFDEEYITLIIELPLGGSIQISDMTSLMSIVRIR